MSFWRSNTVNCYQLILPRENAHRIVQQLGRMPNLAFRPSPHQHQKPFATQIKVIEQALLKLYLLEEKLKASEGCCFPREYSREEFEAFLEEVDRRYRLENRASAHLLEATIEQLSAVWHQLVRLEERLEELGREASGLQEEQAILKGGELLFGSRLYSRPQADDENSRQISFKCGVIGKQDETILRRTLFRMTKGLSLYTAIDYADCQGENKEEVEKKHGRTIFFLILGYGQSRVLSSKVQRLLGIYNIAAYQYPRSQAEAKEVNQRLKQRLSNNAKLAELVKAEIKGCLGPLLQTQHSEGTLKLTRIEYYKLYLMQERQIYQKLNEMKLHHNFYEAFLFVQAQDLQLVTTQLHQQLAQNRMPAPQLIPVASTLTPTLFHLNQVTRTPYEVLSAYGIPHYKEANPALLNLITFPFLFGVMFGDMFHGAILMAFGLMLFRQQLQRNPILDALKPHRFTITLMGFFSLYCGLIYNEFLSLSLNLFGSCYVMGDGSADRKGSCVYPVGVDPVWSVAANGLNFTNSLKMKIAVMIGVAHMTLGLAVKALNYWQAKRPLHIFISVLPQAIFLIGVFGYMDLLIVVKWMTEWSSQPPSIITTMINIPLDLGVTSDCCGGQPMWGSYGNTSQNRLQLFILIISLACIPLMFSLPLLYQLLLRKVRKQRESQLDFNDELRMSGVNGRAENEQEQLLGGNDDGQQQMSLKEMSVYQLIETIEFVLGSISNTASYLRLWALSLAHCELSAVFFSETVERGLQAGFVGIIYNLVLFPIFWAITFGILLCMDSMECFLHTLRLHWVEFQSKFYRGDGIPFKSADFLTALNLDLQLAP